MQIGYKMPGCLKQTLGLVISAILILMTWNEGLAAEIAIERNEFVNLLANVKILKENLSSADRQITLYKRLDADQKRLSYCIRTASRSWRSTLLPATISPPSSKKRWKKQSWCWTKPTGI